MGLLVRELLEVQSYHGIRMTGIFREEGPPDILLISGKDFLCSGGRGAPGIILVSSEGP